MGLPCNFMDEFCWFCKWYFVSDMANYRQFPSFRNFCNRRWAFSATLWINFVDFVSSMANHRNFRSFRKFCKFHNSRTFRRAFPTLLWINVIDFVSGLANYRKFCSFRSCVQSWTLLDQNHLYRTCVQNRYMWYFNLGFVILFFATYIGCPYLSGCWS